MNKSELKSILEKEEKSAHIYGWDFSHIEVKYEEEKLSWDYKNIIEKYFFFICI